MVTCHSCGNENPDGFRFCGFCAAPLEGPPATAELEERKVVSVLFCDLVGFTATSERQDPEDVRARIRPYHARIRREIERYDGTVEKFIGDAVMAAFGAPVTHEDDPERAVRAGLRILGAIEELNHEEPGLELHVRIGINTGEAVVAVHARPEHGETLVTGDVVNTAARIQGAAPVNGIAVSEQTYSATSRVFEYEPLEAVSAKGKAEPLPLWRPTAARFRFGRDVGLGFTTPFVGRELEKPLLIGIFERAAQQRSVQLVTVVGEPGVGKSRLCAELFAYIEAKPEIVRWRQGRCLPYGEGITFWALGEIVKAEAGILESDSAEVAVGKLDAALPPTDPARQWLLQRLGPLVGVEAPSPSERDELFAVWRQYLEGLAAGRPSVLVFEDLHWADEALLSFLEYLAEWSQGVPLLVLCAARPELYERRPGWGAGQRNAHTINLSPLSEHESGELVAHLLAGAGLDPELEATILQRSGGNPLYAEEFVRLLAERRSGADPPGEALPDTVQALIAARLDTLPPDRKSLLQDAAVVGKVFWAGAVAEIGGHRPDEVELALHELARKELVRPARTTSMDGEREYSFWHLLVRDVAYAQIPRAERARRHRAAAGWIERKGGERVEDLAEVLAHHYLQALELAEAAGDDEQADEVAPHARRFLALAGERALGLDTLQAEARLAHALELTPAEDPERPELVVRWAEAALQAGLIRDVSVALDHVLEPLRRHAETETTARALQLSSTAALRLGSGRQLELAAEAVRLLEREAPNAVLVHAYAQLANMQSLAGAYAEAIVSAERAASIAEQLGLDRPARALSYRGYARANLGDADGIAEMEVALRQLEDQGAWRDAAAVRNNLAIARYPLEGPAHALAEFEAGIALCDQRGLGESSVAMRANCPGLLAELGRTDEALERAREFAAAADAVGQMHSVVELRAVEMACRLARGERPEPADVDWLVEAARTIGASDISIVALAAAAEALAAAEPDRAHAALADTEEAPGSRGTPYYARQLPYMVRTAIVAGDDDLAARLCDRVEASSPLQQHALAAARALLAERGGDLADAARLNEAAAAGWNELGNVAERAYALLGTGRCLRRLDAEDAEQPLRDARELFESMGYATAAAEAAALLEGAPAKTP